MKWGRYFPTLSDLGCLEDSLSFSFYILRELHELTHVREYSYFLLVSPTASFLCTLRDVNLRLIFLRMWTFTCKKGNT